MWTMGLLKTMNDPKCIVYSDKEVVMIKDKYPKAKYHFLVICKENISSIKVINSKHIPLLEHMEKKAKDYTAKHIPNVTFKYGYHAQASMHRLHLHVISNDMESDYMKTKKHWNSFTTKFFLNSADIIKQLQTEGKIKIPSATECEKYMKKELKCHCCDATLSNIPKLKQHIHAHIEIKKD